MTLHDLVLCSNTEGIKILLAQQPLLNEWDTNGQTPLHYAVIRGDIDTVRILLEAGADPNAFAKDGVTPKWHAEDFGLEEIADILTLYGGKVQANGDCDKASWSTFLGFIGQDLPPEKL